MRRTMISTAMLVFGLVAFIPAHGEAAMNTSVSHANVGHGGGPFGLGVMFGDPTGLSAKYWTSGSTAFSFGLATSWRDYIELAVDHDWHFPSAFGGAPFVPYIGIGAGLFFDTYDRVYGDYAYRQRFFSNFGSSSLALALRIPMGVEFLPRTVPMGLFVELTPALGIFPGMFGFMQAALGGRYYF